MAQLAHELRTPLNAMVGWLHLLASGVGDDLRERALAGLKRAIEQQRRVVETLDTPVDNADLRQPAPPAGPVGEAPRRARTVAGGPRATPANGAEKAERPSSALLEGVCILAVDDDPDVLQMLRSLLEHSGATVESTTSPDDALRRYASWARGGGERLVVSDLAMHERDGISLMNAIRELEVDLRLRRLPAIALSAHFRPETRRKAFDGGFDLFLAKPIDPTVLLNHLRNMLDR